MFQIRKEYLLLLGFILFPIFYFTQINKIQVIDKENKTPIFLSHVKISCIAGEKSGKSFWTVSDEMGFTNNPYQDSVLVSVSFIGYRSTSVRFGNLKLKIIKLEKDVFGLNEIVITGNSIPIETKDYVYDVTVLDKNKIQEKGADNLREALNNELTFKTNNGHVNETAITLNGLSGNHIKILIDGVPVEGRLNGNIDLSQINMNDVERIEIIEGPTSVTYGTNALGGVINIITKKYQYKKIDGNIKSMYESIGQYNMSGRIGFKFKKNTVKISGGRHFFDGYAFRDTSRFKDWKPREQYFGSLLFNRKIKNFRLFYILNAFNEHITSRGLPRSPYNVNAFDTHYRTNRISNKVLLNGKILKNKNLDIILSQSHYKRVRNIVFKDLVTLSETPTEGSNDQDTTTFNSYMLRSVFKTQSDSSILNYTAGIEYKSDQIISNRIAGNSNSISDLAVFGDLKIKPNNNITVQPAFRYAYNTRYKAPIIPSVNLLYNLNDNFELRGSYAKGFRSPSLKELYIEFHYNSTINLWGNEDLKSENSNHFNFSMNYHSKFKNHFIQIIPKFFYSKIENMINLIPFTSVDWKYSNVDFLTTKGTSLALKYSFKQIDFNFLYSYYGNYNSMFDDSSNKNKYFYSNDFISKISYKMDSLDAKISLEYKYTGTIKSYYFDLNNKIKDSYISDYNTFNATFSKSFFHKKLILNTGIKNIFNIKKIEMTGAVFGVSKPKNVNYLNVLWGRSFFVSLNYKF